MTAGTLDRWLVRPRPAPIARMRLFCFPIAGSNASAYQGFPEGLPSDVDVCAVQFPGRQQRATEAPYRRMALATSELDRAIQPFLDLPFAFFGLCTGTLVAYDLAHRLARHAGVQPVHFFAGCCRAPHMPDRDQPMHAMPEEAFWTELERLGGTPPVICEHPELKSILSPLLRADFELAETYRYNAPAPLRCPITVFGGLQDGVVSPEELNGWSQHTTATCDIRMLAGGHYLLDSGQEQLLAIVSDTLHGHLLRT